MFLYYCCILPTLYLPVIATLLFVMPQIHTFIPCEAVWVIGVVGRYSRLYSDYDHLPDLRRFPSRALCCTRCCLYHSFPRTITSTTMRTHSEHSSPVFLPFLLPLFDVWCGCWTFQFKPAAPTYTIPFWCICDFLILKQAPPADDTTYPSRYLGWCTDYPLLFLPDLLCLYYPHYLLPT